ncbi:TlpA family protein disulfide reductase [Bacteroides ovatus]|uniref:TlpA family protein disulfide reductase n=1 Tax=Bacteroides ovatus TaxID=28116 RepID=UPI0022E5E0F1|nr:TlpA disulfide reductase family protein [Bacteroides ovatus]
MKTTLFCILLLLSGIVSAQTIDHPPFKARSGSISNITRIERTPENTRVYIHAIFRPHWWIMEDGDTYLEDAATGKKYLFKSAEGIELKKEVYMPDSGTMDYVLVFEPLPSETQTIHFLNPTDPEGNIYDISLVLQKKKDSSPLATIKCNWFKTDGSGSWEYGVYDSISILNNRIYINENIRKKGKRIEMTLKDRESQEEMTLSFTPQKDGTCKIQQKGAEELVYSKERTPITQVAAEPDFKQFFRQDSTYLQGYINGYDPRLGFDTGLIYLSNELTREDYPTVIQIAPNGSFSCRFIINHPIESSVVLGHNWIPFYIEPGQTLTMYIDWEAVMARSRARDHYFPIRNTAYMGPSASLSYLLKDFDNLITYRYEDLSKSQKTLTPDQYKEHMKPIIAQWKQVADSVSQIYQPSLKAVHLIKNKVDLQAGSMLFDFLMSRDYYTKQDSTNQALKVKEDDSYYSFLKDMPLNDVTVLANTNASTFINRFEYMDLFRKAYSDQSFSPSDSIDYTYPKKPLLTFLKEKGVKLNKEQEAIRLRQEKLAGTTAKIIMRQLIAENEKMASLYEKEQKLIQEYVALYSEKKEESQQDKDKIFIKMNQKYDFKKDSIIAQLYPTPNPLLWQIAKVRSLNFNLGNIKDSQIAHEYVDSIKQIFTEPFLASEAERVLEKTHPKDRARSYQLPDGKATEVFRNIIKNHSGKVLFVDFWTTTCGPCRAGIEATADLRKKYKDHPEFQFIYITSQKDSPEKDYKKYVEKNLKGEACYYVSEAEFNYLRQLFQFNGIPHYELVEKDGSISKERLSSYNIRKYLDNHFKGKTE